MSIRGVSSDWIDVLSGVPHGSVLGPVLFLIFINDYDFGIKSWILKFADDTKILSSQLLCRFNSLQMDLHTLITSSEEWQMLFNVRKCKVMHVGTMQFERQYLVNDQKLEVVTQEKDLGVVISNDVKVSQQCSRLATQVQGYWAFYIEQYSINTVTFYFVSTSLWSEHTWKTVYLPDHLTTRNIRYSSKKSKEDLPK